MRLVIRGNGIYAYRSVRRNGKVTSEYLGSGLVAMLRAEDAEEEAEAKEAARESLRALEEEDLLIDEALGALARTAREAGRRALEESGYHLVARGRWRKRRVPRDR